MISDVYELNTINMPEGSMNGDCEDFAIGSCGCED